MSKNSEMLKSFFKVLKGDKTEIDLILPNMYASSVYSINYKLLNKKYKNLIFDLDNTLLPVGKIEVNEELVNLFQKIGKDFNICLVSNNSKERVLPVAKILETGYLFKAGKPKKEAFDKALILLDATKENTAVIGDQMLSDIKGANEYGLFSVMVEPISNIHDFKTKTNRVLQKIMIKKLEKKGIFKEKKFYDGK